MYDTTCKECNAHMCLKIGSCWPDCCVIWIFWEMAAVSILVSVSLWCCTFYVLDHNSYLQKNMASILFLVPYIPYVDACVVLLRICMEGRTACNILRWMRFLHKNYISLFVLHSVFVSPWNWEVLNPLQEKNSWFLKV